MIFDTVWISVFEFRVSLRSRIEEVINLDPNDTNDSKMPQAPSGQMPSVGGADQATTPTPTPTTSTPVGGDVTTAKEPPTPPAATVSDEAATTGPSTTSAEDKSEPVLSQPEEVTPAQGGMGTADTPTSPSSSMGNETTGEETGGTGGDQA